MSAKTADVLLGSDHTIDVWRPLPVFNQLDLDSPMDVDRLTLLARVEWVSCALEDYPTTPTLPEMELFLPCPRWEDL